jgi:ribose/xylose/arabinose/galactoside ABC-type transport system permease subunit
MVVPSTSGVVARLQRVVSRLFQRREGSVLVGLLAIVLVGVYIDASRFLLLDNLARVLRAAATTAIIGYGVALLMVTAEFDLSVGSMYAITAGMGAIMIGGDAFGFDPLFAAIVILVFAFCFGITQGLLVTKLELPSLIVTIGTLTLLRGVHRILLGGTTASARDIGVLKWLGGPIILEDLPVVGGAITYQLPLIHEETHSFEQFSVLIVWIFVFLAIFHYLLYYTRFGLHARATGDNVESVETTGIDPEMIKIGCFGICATTAAFAGLAFLGRFGSVSSGSGSGLALVVIAAVVLGGTKLTGGEGSMTGVLLGAMVLATANNVLSLAGLNVSGWQGVITGGFIIAAIGLDVLLKGFSLELLRSWYVRPMGQLVRSPSGFFEDVAEQKTTDEMFGFLAMGITVTALGTNVLAWLVGRAADGGLIGLELGQFKLFLLGGWPETVAQTYLFVLLMAVSAVLTVQLAVSVVQTSRDYEETLRAVCYGLAPAPLFAIPIVFLGYGMLIVVNSVVTALLLSVPILLLVGWMIAVGVRGTHGLSRTSGLLTAAAVVCSWVLLGGVVALGVGVA